jgi:hypothetical protein
MEILFSIASMVIGSAMFAYIVGNISSVVTNVKGQEIKLRQRMRELQEYIALRKIPKSMADQLRRQCMHRWKRTVFDEERYMHPNWGLELHFDCVLEKKVLEAFGCFLISV